MVDPSNRSETKERPNPQEKLVKVFDAERESEALVVSGLLESAGIDNDVTSTDAARTVPAALAFFTGSSQFEQPTASIAAAAVVVTIPIVLLVLVFQRRIVAGLTAGAVKG